jgi:hypothetical protein
VHKVDRTLANRVVERRNMINVYLRGEFVSGGVFDFVSVSSSLLCLHFATFRAIC